MNKKFKWVLFIVLFVGMILPLNGCGKATYAISFVGGEETTGEVPTIEAKSEGDKITLPANTLTKDGYLFVGWNDGSQTYEVGEEYTIQTFDVTFTAVWHLLATELEIQCDVKYVDDNGTRVGGSNIELSVNVTPVEATDPLVWKSSDESVATVVDGIVTPVAVGEAIITVESVYNSNIKDEFTVVIWPSEVNSKEVLMEAERYLVAHMPKYIDETFTFDVLYPEHITYAFESLSTSAKYTDTYNYEYSNDAQDKLKCVMTYRGETMTTYLDIHIVGDAENNEFTKLAAVSEKVEEIFANYTSGNKVDSNITLPATFAGYEEVVVTYKSNNATVLTDSGTYIRPNDDTDISLLIALMITYTDDETVSYGNTATMNIDLTIKGYSKEEKLEIITSEVVPQAIKDGVIVMTNVNLPLQDSTFKTQVEWSSSHPNLFTNTGIFQTTEEAAIELTAKITYTSTNTSESFVEEIVYNVELALSDNAAVVAIYYFEKTQEYQDLLSNISYFPYGKAGRENNILPLISSYDLNDNVITLKWSCSESDLFSDEWELQKQYLRYHLVTLTYEVEQGTDTATSEIEINVGISELLRTAHIAGSFSRLAPTTSRIITNRMDSIPVMSAFDGEVVPGQNNATTGFQTAYYQPILIHTDEEGNVTRTINQNPYYYDEVDGIKTYKSTLGVGQSGGFAGYTWYYDVSDADTGEVTRYQYYFDETQTWVIDNDHVDTDTKYLKLAESDKLYKDGVYTGTKFLSLGGRQHAQYNHYLYVNESDYDVIIPIRHYGIVNTVFGPGDDVSVNVWDINDNDGRNLSLTVDGSGCPVAVVNSTGEVVYSHTTIAPNSENPAMYITIPSGGFAWCSGEGQVNTTLNDIILTVGNKLTVQKWNVHPYNSVAEIVKSLAYTTGSDQCLTLTGTYWAHKGSGATKPTSN